MKAFAQTKVNNTGVLLLVVASAFLTWSNAAMAQIAASPVPLPPPAPAPAGMMRMPPPPPPMPVSHRPGRANPELPLFQKIAPGLYSLGEIQISKSNRSVSLPVQINMKKGLLEYLLVRTSGKTYESLLRTQVDPTALQMAMLLVGVEGTDHPLSRQGDPETPQGNPVDITVSYLKDGRLVQVRPEIWVARKSDDKMGDTDPLQWVFTGSNIYQGRFMAEATGSIIAIYHDPVAMFDNASPGGETNRVWFVNEGTVPPVGTPLTLTITVKN